MRFAKTLTLQAYLLALLASALLVLLLVKFAYSLTLLLPESGDNIVGEIQVIVVQPGDTLHGIARAEDVGIVELLAANPGLNPKRLKIGQEIIIPTAYILPQTPRDGIVINLAEMRLYFFPSNQGVVMTFPIGVGREGWETPVSNTYVLSKEEYPYWFPPESIREHVVKTKGYLLPEKVPPGPKNPLGDFAIRLALTSYLIHGTNNPSSIGKRSSSGCIRMYPEDIEQLFYQIAEGTPVYIIHDPYKLGWYKHELYLEAHKPLAQYDDYYQFDNKIYKATWGKQVNIDWNKTKTIKKRFLGFPIYIGNQI